MKDEIERHVPDVLHFHGTVGDVTVDHFVPVTGLTDVIRIKDNTETLLQTLLDDLVPLAPGVEWGDNATQTAFVDILVGHGIDRADSVVMARTADVVRAAVRTGTTVSNLITDLNDRLNSPEPEGLGSGRPDPMLVEHLKAFGLSKARAGQVVADGAYDTVTVAHEVFGGDTSVRPVIDAVLDRRTTARSLLMMLTCVDGVTVRPAAANEHSEATGGTAAVVEGTSDSVLLIDDIGGSRVVPLSGTIGEDDIAGLFDRPPLRAAKKLAARLS